jgi:glycosyltransferase involved in cell wall biosynthesis
LSKTISIIIATFNSAKTLDKCLRSIISQKNSSIELIVVDAKSTDQTLNILKIYEQSIDHIISESDEGIYDAWNKGVKVSRGKWIMFVGSDDELRMGCIASYNQEIIDSLDYDYISGRIMLINEDGDELREFGQPHQWSVFRTIMNLAHVSALHNRRYYDIYGYYNTNFKICGDYELLLRAKNRLKVKFIDKTLANMTIGGTSYGSFAALKETRKAKLLHKVSSTLSISVDHYFAVIKLCLKKTLVGFRLWQ